MRSNTATRVGLMLACFGAIGAAGVAPLDAAEPGASQEIQVTGAETGVHFVPLGIGKSVVIDLPRDAKDVLVANPVIANAVVRSTRRAYLIGIGIGQTNVYFFDAEGRQIAGFDIAVTRDLNGIRQALRQILPDANVRIEGLGPDGIVLSGTVANAGDSQRAFDLAARLLGDPTGSKVANSLIIKARDQVMLKVTVAEVQRDVVKQLGINRRLGYGNTVLNFNTDTPFSAGTGAISDTKFIPGWVNGSNSIKANVRAMEQAGLIRTLAEPNLTAISGETASFLAGGQFPVTTRNCDTTGLCTLSTIFKNFGVSLNFTPVVLSEGRISLKVMSEVSELSNEGAVAGIPGLKTRKVDTTVEIPSGGALAMAGMIQEQSKQAINGVPGLMQVPILGTLFKSRDYLNRQSELVVLVTPYVVHAVAQKQLSRPADGFADASDPSQILMSKFNRLYGPSQKDEARRPYHGSYGFILD